MCMYVCVEREGEICVSVSVFMCVCVHILPSINTELVGHMSQIPCTLCNIMIASEILSAL